MQRHVRRPFRFLDAFYKETRNPIWLLLQKPQDRLHLEAALIESKVPPAEFTRWRPSLLQPTLSHAPDMPSWVVLYQLLYNVRSPSDASGPLLELLHAHLPYAPANLHAPLLVLTAHHLATHALQVPLQPLVARFLETPIPLEDQEHAFNLLLRALASSPVRSVPSANNVVLLLSAMNDRQIPLRPSTYRALLNDRFVTLQLTKHLHAKMLKEGIVPTAEHLEAFLRVFAKNGAIHEARKYFAAIHALTRAPREDGRDVRLSANTLMLGAHDDKASAFAFLRRLAELSSPSTTTTSTPGSSSTSTSTTSTIQTQKPTLPRPTSKIRFISHPPNSTTTSIYDQTTALHIASTDLSTPTRTLIHLFLHLSAPPTVATYTVLIRGLLKRKEWAKAELFWRRLARLCVGGSRAAGGASREEMTEGERGALGNAPTYMRQRRMVMDNAALTAGLQALVRGGKAHRAIKVLEKYAWKPGVSPVRVEEDVGSLAEEDGDDDTTASSSSSSSSSKPAPTPAPKKPPLLPPPIRLTTITLNELLVSLKRAARPDAVLFLFQHMTTLYGVQPNESSLCIMLQSARMAEGMDDGVMGVVERMKMRVGGWRAGASVVSSSGNANTTTTASALDHQTASNSTTTFTSSTPSPPTPSTRLSLITHLHSILGSPTQKHPTPYKSSTQLSYPYRGAGPAEFARGVFLEAVWGGAWSGGYDLLARGGGVDGSGRGVRGRGKGKGREVEGGRRQGGAGEGNGARGARGIDLSEVKSPARAVREDEDGETSLRSLWRGARDEERWVPPRGVVLRPPSPLNKSNNFDDNTPSTSQTSSNSLTPTHTSHPLHLPPSRHPSLLPTTPSFSAYLALLSTSGPASDVALVFAWMRRLGVVPSDECLGVGLGVWEGVSCGGLLVERWGAAKDKSLSPAKSMGQGQDKGKANETEADTGKETTTQNTNVQTDTMHGLEYHKLTSFLSDWLGPKRVPGEKEMRKWRDVVRKMRERVRGGGGGGGEN